MVSSDVVTEDVVTEETVEVVVDAAGSVAEPAVNFIDEGRWGREKYTAAGGGCGKRRYEEGGGSASLI